MELYCDMCKSKQDITVKKTLSYSDDAADHFEVRVYCSKCNHYVSETKNGIQPSPSLAVLMFMEQRLIKEWKEINVEVPATVGSQVHEFLTKVKKYDGCQYLVCSFCVNGRRPLSVACTNDCTGYRVHKGKTDDRAFSCFSPTDEFIAIAKLLSEEE
jgi:hypothetical protein